MSYEYTLVMGVLNLLIGLWCFTSGVRLGLSILDCGGSRVEKTVCVIGIVLGLGLFIFAAYSLATIGGKHG
jgi:hypothetical protein